MQGFDGLMPGEFRHGQEIVGKQFNQFGREIMAEAVGAVSDAQILQEGGYDVSDRPCG